MKIYPNYGDIYSFKRKFEKSLERDKGLTGQRSKVSLRLMKRYKWELTQLLSVFEPDPKIKIFFEKKGGGRRKQC